MTDGRRGRYLPQGRKTSIYVGNLPLTVTEGELSAAFAEYGQLLSVRIMNDKYIGSSQPRGYAYVEMAVRKEAEAAILALDGRIFNGNAVSVIESMPLSPVSAPSARQPRARRP